MVRLLKFTCQRDSCSLRNQVFSYEEFWADLDVHLELDCAESINSDFQPQNSQMNQNSSGVQQIDQRQNLPNQEDIVMRISDEEEKKVEEKKVEKKDEPAKLQPR